MNLDRDPLEAELQAMTPQELGPQMRDCIAEQIPLHPVWKERRQYALFGTGALLAACVIVALMLWNPMDSTRKQTPVSPALATAQTGQPRTSVAAYERAFARSAADLDAVLDTDANSNYPTPPLRALPRLHQELVQ